MRSLLAILNPETQRPRWISLKSWRRAKRLECSEPRWEVLLADPPLNVDGMILEQVYPALSQAIEDRLQIHMGILGSWFAPLLMSTVKPHLGFSLDEMRPIDKIGKIHSPKLFIVGDADRHTKIGESLAMFDAASAPKELWIVHGARHIDFYCYSGSAYQIRVLDFFNQWLRGPSLR